MDGMLYILYYQFVPNHQNAILHL